MNDTSAPTKNERKMGGGGTCLKPISELEKKLVWLGHKESPKPCATVCPGFCLLEAITSAPHNLNKE